MALSARAWWHSAAIYELYPSSFKDSNADGIGDIRGIISKIPYLKSLGIDAVWLAGCCKSSGVDMGYDVVDYRDIDSQYGTVADIEVLVAELEKVGIKLIMDLVINHTSSGHAWFRQSRSSKDNPKRDWYIWRKGQNLVTSSGEVVRKPPNNWRSAFKGTAWTHDELTDEWYLHIFAKEQPDLKWDNPEVRRAIYSDMRFWLDKGIAGFRMDVINIISKVPGLPDVPVQDPTSDAQDANQFYTNGPNVHAYLQEMHSEVLCHYPSIIKIGETICTSDPSIVKQYITPSRNELSMAYIYDFFTLDADSANKFYPRTYTPSEFKNIVVKWSTALAFPLCQALWLESHDTGRSVSRFCNDNPKGAKMLALLESTLPGTLFIYQGQELGLANLSDDVPIASYPDLETQRTRQDILQTRAKVVQGCSVDMTDIDREIRLKARDHARAPLPWTNELPHAGFSDAARTWSPMNTSAIQHANIAAQSADPNSILNFWRKRIFLRKMFPSVLIFGDFVPLQDTAEEIFGYWRIPPGGGEVEGMEKVGVRSVLVVMNLTEKEGVRFHVPVGWDSTPRKFFVLQWTENGDELTLGESGTVESGEEVRLSGFQGIVFGY